MSTIWAVLVLVVVALVLIKLFKKMAIALLIFLLAELLVIIVWPQVLTGLAELAVKVRELVQG